MDNCGLNFLTFALLLVRKSQKNISLRKIELAPAEWDAVILPLDHTHGQQFDLFVINRYVVLTNHRLSSSSAAPYHQLLAIVHMQLDGIKQWKKS